MSKDILTLAREAGFVEYEIEDYTTSGYDIRYERLVELARADAIAAEREACAQVCDWYVDYSSNPMNFAENCAQEIRARGKKS